LDPANIFPSLKGVPFFLWFSKNAGQWHKGKFANQQEKKSNLIKYFIKHFFDYYKVVILQP